MSQAVAMQQSRYVAYYRVSTQRQGRSGLGLEAQRRSVNDHISGRGLLVASYTEIESARITDRPKLAEALAACRLHRATLVIARLDRLARNVAFVSNLLEAGSDFEAVDFPQANRLTIHVMAAFAEHEARMISERTKAALASAKARGIVLGGFRGRAGTCTDLLKARAARASKANQRAIDLLPTIRSLRQEGNTSFGCIASGLNARQIATARGGRWSATQVRRILMRLQDHQYVNPHLSKES